MELIISGNDKDQLKKVEDMARRMGLSVTRKKNKPVINKKENQAELLKLMQDMAASGGIQSIKDPVEWQNAVRKDRPLPGRE